MADIADTVKSVLISPSARKIDFHMGLMHVDAAGLLAIRALIIAGMVRVKVVPMKKNTAAAYNYAANTLKFPRADYGADVQEKSDILHECIHALHDIYGGSYYHPRGGSRFMTESENEAAAYVADALYYWYETGKVQGTASQAIFVKAGAIARRIKDMPGAFVTTAESVDLRKAISADYGYGVDQPTGANGP